MRMYRAMPPFLSQSQQLGILISESRISSFSYACIMQSETCLGIARNNSVITSCYNFCPNLDTDYNNSFNFTRTCKPQSLHVLFQSSQAVHHYLRGLFYSAILRTFPNYSSVCAYYCFNMLTINFCDHNKVTQTMMEFQSSLIELQHKGLSIQLCCSGIVATL